MAEILALSSDLRDVMCIKGESPQTKGKTMKAAGSYDYIDAMPSFEEREANRKQNTRIPEQDRSECFLCQRPVNSRTIKTWVHMGTNGALYKNGEEAADSQGLFPIGSECLKRLEKDFIIKFQAGA